MSGLSGRDSPGLPDVHEIFSLVTTQRPASRKEFPPPPPPGSVQKNGTGCGLTADDRSSSTVSCHRFTDVTLRAAGADDHESAHRTSSQFASRQVGAFTCHAPVTLDPLGPVLRRQFRSNFDRLHSYMWGMCTTFSCGLSDNFRPKPFEIRSRASSEALRGPSKSSAAAYVCRYGFASRFRPRASRPRPPHSPSSLRSGHCDSEMGSACSVFPAFALIVTLPC